jgi:hypothetical protein
VTALVFFSVSGLARFGSRKNMIYTLRLRLDISIFGTCFALQLFFINFSLIYPFFHPIHYIYSFFFTHPGVYPQNYHLIYPLNKQVLARSIPSKSKKLAWVGFVKRWASPLEMRCISYLMSPEILFPSLNRTEGIAGFYAREHCCRREVVALFVGGSHTVHRAVYTLE